jgi:tetratricopeptide (TPR) repeat protein
LLIVPTPVSVVIAMTVTTAIVFPSSTSRDLPDERAAILDACRALHLAVATMEDFPATGAGATRGSLAQLDKCHVYVGVFAHRYGHVEPGHPCSVTEAEYDHAHRRGLECLCFFLADDAPWPAERIEHDGLPRLQALKQRIQAERIVRWFRNADHLRYEVFRALLDWLERTGRRPRGPWQVPAPPADFVGRRDDLAALLDGFDAGAAIVGARGLGGVGKTTLALVLAQRLADRFPDGQVFLDLRGADPKPVSWRDAAGHVVRAYRPDERLPDDDAALLGLYRTVLHGKRALLLLDNAAGAAQVEPLRPPAGCALLVTSRRRFALPGLLARDLDALPPADAVALLQTIAPRVGGRAVEVAELCGRLPLALRLAGALLAERDDLAVDRYVERLRAARLSERSGLAEVAAALRLSEALLPEPLRARWRELAVLVEGFEAGWAAAVWGVDADTGDDWLGMLRRNSLVEWSEAEGFYRLHDLVREYATAELGVEERLAAQRRHAGHFRAVLAEANKLYLKGGAVVGTAVRAFDRAWTNAAAAQEWARQQTDDAEAQRLCVAFPHAAIYLLQLRRHPREQIGWLEAAVAAAREIGDRGGEGAALGNLGLAYADLGQPQRAIEFYEQHLVIAREIGDRGGEGNALGNLGLAYKNLGQPQRAIECHEQALVISREIGDRRGEGATLGNLGLAYADLGQPQRAIECHEQALVISREIGDRRGEGAALGNLGLAYADLGQPQRAIEFHEQYLAIAREIGDRRGEGNALGNLGIAYTNLGQPQRAIEHYEQQLTIAREIGDRRGEANACWNLGLQLVKLDRSAEAIPLMEVCVRFEQEIGHPDAEKDAAHVERLRQRVAGQEPQPPA